MAVAAPKTQTSIAHSDTSDRSEIAADWNATAKMTNITVAVMPMSWPKLS